MIRMTEGMTAATTINAIDNDYTRMSQDSNVVTTGKSINQPSDNPYGASLAIQLQSTLDGLTAYSSSAANASDWQQAAGTALSTITQVVQQARTLVVEAGNGTNSQSDLNDIADEVNQLIDQVKSSANTQYDGSYIFSGTDTQTPPYQAGSDDTFQGNTSTINAAISPGTTVPLNNNLSAVLGNGSAAADGGLLDTLRTISSDLTSGNTSGLETTDLTNLDTNISSLTDLSASSGAIVDQLTLASTSIQTLQTNTTALLANDEDADEAQAMINYTQAQSAYSASLQAGASIVQESLLNFLGSAA